MSLVRKVSFGIAASSSARHALAIARTAEREDLPGSYRTLVEASSALAEAVREEARAIFDAVNVLAEAGCATLEIDESSVHFEEDEETLDEGEDELPDEWIPHGWELRDIDLKRLFSAEDEECARALYDLVLRLEPEEPFHAYSLKLGAARGDIEQLRALLEAYARAYRVKLDAAQRVDADFGEEGSEYDEEVQDERVPPRGSRPEQTSKGGAGKQSKTGAKWSKGEGFFGGLPDDEPGAARGKHARPDGLHRLTPDEEFFLMRAALVWPVDGVRLELAWRAVVLCEHPDKNPDDPGAHHRFVALKGGFESLKRRVTLP